MTGAALITPARKLAWATVIGAAFLCAWVEIIGLDTWWHLAVGRSVLETGSSLPRDIFSYSFAGAPWPYKDVLAAVLLYLGHQALGLHFFVLLKALFVLALAGAFVVRREVDALLGLAVFALVLLAIRYSIVDRPLLLSLALLPYGTLALERLAAVARDPATRGRALGMRLAQLLALLYAGTLLHRGTLVLYMVFGAYALAALAAWLSPASLADRLLGGAMPRRAALAIAGTALASPLLALGTPCGLAFFRSGVSGSMMPFLREHVTEWKQLPPAKLVAEFPAATALVVITLGTWSWLRWARRQPVSVLHPALIALLVGFACTWVRWVPMLSLVTAALLLRHAELASAVVSAWPHRTRALATALVGTGLLTMLAVHSPLRHRFGLKPEFEPVSAMHFAREQELGPRMANAFNLGGYPLWYNFPEQRVLFDSRAEQLYPSDFMVEVVSSESSPDVFARLAQRWHFDWVAACNRPGQLSHAFLWRDPAWWLVHYSEAALIYVRADRYPRLAPLRFRFLDPVAPDIAVLRTLRTAQVGGAVWRQLDTELRRARQASPLGLRVLASSVLFFHHSGPSHHRARDALLVTLDAEHADHPALLQLLQLLQAPPMAPGAR